MLWKWQGFCTKSCNNSLTCMSVVTFFKDRSCIMKPRLFSLLLLLLCINIFPFTSEAQRKIKKRRVADLSLMMDSESLLLPGTTFPIGFQVVMTDGETANTKGYSDGKVKWDNFEVTVKGGTFNEGFVNI